MDQLLPRPLLLTKLLQERLQDNPDKKKVCIYFTQILFINTFNLLHIFVVDETEAKGDTNVEDPSDASEVKKEEET